MWLVGLGLSVRICIRIYTNTYRYSVESCEHNGCICACKSWSEWCEKKMESEQTCREVKHMEFAKHKEKHMEFTKHKAKHMEFTKHKAKQMHKCTTQNTWNSTNNNFRLEGSEFRVETMCSHWIVAREISCSLLTKPACTRMHTKLPFTCTTLSFKCTLVSSTLPLTLRPSQLKYKSKRKILPPHKVFKTQALNPLKLSNTLKLSSSQPLASIWQSAPKTPNTKSSSKNGKGSASLSAPLLLWCKWQMRGGGGGAGEVAGAARVS